MTQKEQQELNRKRSTGSAGGRGPDKLEDPTEIVQQAINDRERVSAEAEAVQLDNNAEAPATMNAESVIRNVNRVSFKIDYLKSPEDALAMYQDHLPPGTFSNYMQKHFYNLVKIAAEETGEDPAQIADKNRRTPEQNKKLSEIAGRMQLARIDAFFASNWVSALTVLDNLEGTTADVINRQLADILQISGCIESSDVYIEATEDAETTIKTQAVLYFFAIHDDIKPTAKGKLTDQQAAEVTEIYSNLVSFYRDYSEQIGDQIPAEDFSKVFYQFVEDRHPAEDLEKILPRVYYKNSNQVKTATDKLMNVFFSLDAPGDKKALAGQMAMIPVKYEGGKSKKEITLFYDYEYNEKTLESFGIPKGFDSYDYFVATALDNLKENGNDIVSYSKILEEMGMTGRPAEKQIEKLAAALIKGASTTIHINDLEVQKAWGNTDRYTEIIMPVFPIVIKNERYLANGYITDGIIKISDYSPFRGLAESLGHLSLWDKRILQLYTGRKTDRYWNTLRLLIREIGWMRNKKSKRGNKILYSSIYKTNGDNTTRAKQLSRDMVYRLLDEVFIPTGYVRSYREDNSTTPGVILQIGDPHAAIE